MWQRFTERARKVVFYAQEEAQRRGEGYVSTEHLLLGLLRESDSVAFRVLETFVSNPKDISERIDRMMPRGDTRPSQDMTLTPRAKRVIDLAYNEARDLGNDYIGTEHLLLGLIREGDGLAGHVLSDFAVTLESAREVAKALQLDKWDKPRVPVAPQPQFERENLQGKLWRLLDNSAKEALFYAQEESQCFADRRITPALILLGVFYERRNRASLGFRRVGIDPERVIQLLERSLNRVERGDSLDLILSQEARRVIEDAVDEADQQGQPLAGPDHLVLGILRDRESLTSRTIAEAGDVEEICASLARVSHLIRSPMRYSIARMVGMWDRLSDEAKLSMHVADAVASAQGVRLVSSEHLLLGLLRDDNALPRQLLAELGVGVDALTEEAESTMKQFRPPAVDRALDDRCVGLLGLALSYARSFGRDKIGPEDLLLAIANERHGEGGKLLAKYGVTLEPLIEAVRRRRQERGFLAHPPPN